MGLGVATAPVQAQPIQSAPKPPTSDYYVYVGAESADLIHRIKFGPTGAVVEKTIPVGESAVEMEGPHGLQISQDGKYLHMTTGHGSPDGKYWKFALGPDTLVGPGIFLGYFPASIDVTPDGLYAFVVNFNLHGEMVPSSVSVVYTPTNTEVARTTTCTMPHGSRVDPAGTHQYSTCMMDDQLVELDTRTFEVSRRFSLVKGKEAGIPAKWESEHAKHMAAGHKMPMPPASCSPTWAQPGADGKKVYVACNKSDEILEIDRATWTVSRRLATGRGPYNLAATPDGRLLIASLKQGGGVQVFDLATGRSVMNTKSSTTVTHGVAVSSDSRYAFVSNESVGAKPGVVDIYDLRAFTRVASVEVGQQAGGIAFWKATPALAPPAPEGARHFVFFGRDRERITEALFVANPVIAGAQLRYSWRELEPERDRYDFAAIARDIATLARHDKRLWIQLQDASFSADTRLVPDYLTSDPRYHGGVASQYEGEPSKERFAGRMVRRWDPAVRERFIRLLDTLGRAFDAQIEGINLAETAFSTSENAALHPPGFSPDGYAAGVHELMSAARAAFPRSRVIVYANFMPGEWLPERDHGYLRGVYAHAERIGAGVGGPDLLPHRPGQRKHSLRLIAGRGRGTIAGLAVQDGNLAETNRETGGRVSVEELVRYATETLRLDYIFWGTEEPYYSTEILPWLSRHR